MRWKLRVVTQEFIVTFCRIRVAFLSEYESLIPCRTLSMSKRRLAESRIVMC